MSRLGDAVSPYLASHSDQPVDWFSWGVEAFEEAKRRDVPVLISIGYHTCHWCHVMSRETFSDPESARVINDNLVAIKVDREEHPEVDAVYMAQAAAFSENLGWPLNVFATPDGAAFYAATYLPPVGNASQSSFVDVVHAVARAWAEKRDEVEETSHALIQALRGARAAGSSPPGEFPGPGELEAVVVALESYEDREWGGFGQAPKFPIAPVIGFLLGRGDAGDDTASALAHRVLNAYSQSPLRDPVEGGFFRYATKRNFEEPHYERMLYDNAGLLACYSRAGQLDVAEGIVRFFREQLFVAGGLGSATDSESILDGTRNEGGYFRLSATERALVEPPALDDKIVTAWNGLAVYALAIAHRVGVSGEPGALGLDLAAWLWENHHRGDATLVRVSRGGVVSGAVATSEDYGGFALGLIELGITMGDATLVTRGRALVDRVMNTPESLAVDEVLVAKSLSGVDDVNEGASPSGPTLLALAALRLASLTGESHYRDWARKLIAPHIAQALAHPQSFGGVLQVLSELAAKPRELVVVANEPHELQDLALAWRSEGSVCVVVSSDQATAFVEAGFSLFEGRSDVSRPTAFVCEGGVCQMPVTTGKELALALAR
jgi:uncharacterized protein